MLKFIGKRVMYLIVTLLIVSFINFMLIRAIPGDPLGQMVKKMPEQAKANYYAKYGLDKPLLEQYTIFVKKLVLKGDLGESLNFRGRSVSKIIKRYGPVSARIGLQALAIGLSLGVLLGVLAALKRGKFTDFCVMFIAIVGIAVPGFIMASFLQYIFTVKLRWFPTLGWGTFKHTVLPTLALSFGSIALYARYMRSNCLEVLGQDYILTARAKGVSKGALIFKHMLRNAVLPIITIVGPQIALIFLGALVIENIFGIPGLGAHLNNSITNRDYTMIMGMTTLITFIYVISLMVVDMLYGLIDPRIRVGGGKK